MMTEMGWKVDEEMNWDKNEADGINLEVDSKERDDAYLNERSVIFKEEMVGGEKE